MVVLKIVLTSNAYADWQNCISFVLNVSKEAAIKLDDEIKAAIDNLSNYPEKNPIFEMNRTFPFVVRKSIVNRRYIILFSINEQEILVYRILDVRRKFEALI